MTKNPYKRHPMSDRQLVAYAHKRRKRNRIRNAAIGVVAVIAAFGIAVGAYYLWFTSSLNRALDVNFDRSNLDVLSERVGDEPFYMLILGSDARKNQHDHDVSQRTDVMMLARIDVKNKQVTMLSIPRDTPYRLEDGSLVKINELFNIGGVPACVNGVRDITGVAVSHYALVYFSDCKDVVDELGGIEVDVEVGFTAKDVETREKVEIEPGLQVLDGTKARAYARNRHEAEGNQDAFRQGKIRVLLGAIIEKVLDRPAVEIPGVVISLAKYVETDLRADDLIALAMGFATNSGKMTIYQASGPSDGGINDETGLWMCYENPEGWAQVVSVMDSGADPSTVEYE